MRYEVFIPVAIDLGPYRFDDPVEVERLRRAIIRCLHAEATDIVCELANGDCSLSYDVKALEFGLDEDFVEGEGGRQEEREQERSADAEVSTDATP